VGGGSSFRSEGRWKLGLEVTPSREDGAGEKKVLPQVRFSTHKPLPPIICRFGKGMFLFFENGGKDFRSVLR